MEPPTLSRHHLAPAGGQSRGAKGAAGSLSLPESIPGREEGGGAQGEGIPRPFPIRSISSVVSHDGQSPQLAQLGIVLPLPLLVAQAGPVDLRRQVPEDLVHLCVVNDLLRGSREEKDGVSGAGGGLLPHPAVECGVA